MAAAVNNYIRIDLDAHSTLRNTPKCFDIHVLFDILCQNNSS
jgi:hypothetical protein